MYGYGYKYSSGLVLGAGGGAPFVNVYSLSFDGVDDFVSTSASTSGDITLSAWINCNGTYASWQPKYPVSIRTSHAGLVNATIGRFYKLGANLYVMLQIYDNNGANINNYYVPIILEGIGYKHCVWTFDNTTKIINFYLDGVVQTWTKWGGTPSGIPYLTAPGYTYNSNLTIARVNPSTSTGTFNGLVDEVSLFDKILTQEEITSIATAPTDLTSLSPISWYRFEEGSGTIAIDSGSGGNNGTLNNGVAYSTNVPT